MEGNVIILIDIDKETFANEENKKNLYVASSRAKQKLDLIIKANNDELDEIANTIENINVPTSIAKIAMKLKVKPIR